MTDEKIFLVSEKDVKIIVDELEFHGFKGKIDFKELTKEEIEFLKDKTEKALKKHNDFVKTLPLGEWNDDKDKRIFMENLLKKLSEVGK